MCASQLNALLSGPDPTETRTALTTMPSVIPLTRPSYMDVRRHSAFLLGGGGLVAALLATSCFVYLAWHYVPHHAGRLADAHAAFPMSAGWAFFISKWFVRLLPFLVISLFILGPIIAVAIAIAFALLPARTVVRVTGIAALCVAVVEVVLCGIMAYGIHAAYTALG